MLRIICSAQGKFSQEYWRISRKFNAVRGKSDKQKWKVIDEQFLKVNAIQKVLQATIPLSTFQIPL